VARGVTTKSVKQNEMHEQWLGLANPCMALLLALPQERMDGFPEWRMGAKAAKAEAGLNPHAMMSWHCCLILKQECEMGRCSVKLLRRQQRVSSSVYAPGWVT
jgi:hypothetical protein